MTECPFHEEGAGDDGRAGLRDRTLDRRAFVRAALAIGGTGALASLAGCTGAAGGRPSDPGALDVPRGPAGPAAFPERQHAWNDDLSRDAAGNVVLPNYQVLLFLDYAGDGVPSDAERRAVETAFRSLECACQRLAGGDPGAGNDGLVFVVGYGPTYFERFGAPLPASVDLQTPETVLRRTGDDPAKADHFDAVVVLSSDTAAVLLAAEEALFGGIDALNGVPMRETLTGVFSRVERRSAFVGPGLPAERLDTEGIPEGAPLSMGYKSGFGDNVSTEDRVTIAEGPFAGGTTLQVSRLRLDLGEWYDNDREARDELMFSHEHGPEDVGEVGEGLGGDSGVTEEVVAELETTARERGRVGHAAKTARARDENFEPLILRRSEGIDDSFHEGGRVNFNFTAVMEGIEDFVATRRSMDSEDLDEHVEEGGHGILPYTAVRNRATFLVPPRRRRALPAPER